MSCTMLYSSTNPNHIRIYIYIYSLLHLSARSITFLRNAYRLPRIFFRKDSTCSFVPCEPVPISSMIRFLLCSSSSLGATAPFPPRLANPLALSSTVGHSVFSYGWPHPPPLTHAADCIHHTSTLLVVSVLCIRPIC